MTRDWGPSLTDAEFRVLMFVVDHTILWGRPTYRFTYRSFMNGNGVSAGLCKGETQVRAALTALVEKGVIEIKRVQSGLEITPNAEWKPMIAVPKRLRNGGLPSENRGSEPRKTEGQTHGNPRPIIEEHLDEQDSGALRTADAAGAKLGSEISSIPEAKSISVPVPSVRVRTRQVRIENPTPAPAEKCEVSEQGDFFVRGKNVVAAGTSIPARFQSAAAKAKRDARLSMKNPGALFETWKEAWAEAYRDVPGAGCVAWTKQEAGMVKQGLGLTP